MKFYRSIKARKIIAFGLCGAILLALPNCAFYIMATYYSKIYVADNPSHTQRAIFYGQGGPNGDMTVYLLVKSPNGVKFFDRVSTTDMGVIKKTFWSKDGTIIVVESDQDYMTAYNFNGQNRISDKRAVQKAIKKAGGIGTAIFSDSWDFIHNSRMPFIWDVVQFGGHENASSMR